jgi:hypothetical protein
MLFYSSPPVVNLSRDEELGIGGSKIYLDIDEEQVYNEDQEDYEDEDEDEDRSR